MTYFTVPTTCSCQGTVAFLPLPPFQLLLFSPSLCFLCYPLPCLSLLLQHLVVANLPGNEHCPGLSHLLGISPFSLCCLSKFSLSFSVCLKLLLPSGLLQQLLRTVLFLLYKFLEPLWSVKCTWPQTHVPCITIYGD